MSSWEATVMHGYLVALILRVGQLWFTRLWGALENWKRKVTQGKNKAHQGRCSQQYPLISVRFKNVYEIKNVYLIDVLSKHTAVHFGVCEVLLLKRKQT